MRTFLEVWTSIEALAEELAEEAVKDQKEQNKLLSYDSLKARLKEEIINDLQLKEVGASLSQAISLINTEGTEYLEPQELEEMLSNFEEGNKKLTLLSPARCESKTLSELLGITSKTLAAIEKIVGAKFIEKDFSASCDLSLLLAILNPLNFYFWHRLGICYQEKGDLKHAMEAYIKAIELQPESTGTHLFLAECYVCQNDLLEAEKHCEIAKLLNSDGKWNDYISAIEAVTRGEAV